MIETLEIKLAAANEKSKVCTCLFLH